MNAATIPAPLLQSLQSRWLAMDEQEARELNEEGPCRHCDSWCIGQCDEARGEKADNAFDARAERDWEVADGR